MYTNLCRFVAFRAVIKHQPGKLVWKIFGVNDYRMIVSKQHRLF